MGFTAQVDAFAPDMPVGFAGAHKPKPVRPPRGIVDRAFVAPIQGQNLAAHERSSQPDSDLLALIPFFLVLGLEDLKRERVRDSVTVLFNTGHMQHRV